MLSLVENAACGRDVAERQALIGEKLYRQKACRRQNCTQEFATLHKTRESSGNKSCIKGASELPGMFMFDMFGCFSYLTKYAYL